MAYSARTDLEMQFALSHMIHRIRTEYNVDVPDTSYLHLAQVQRKCASMAYIPARYRKWQSQNNPRRYQG